MGKVFRNTKPGFVYLRQSRALEQNSRFAGAQAILENPGSFAYIRAIFTENQTFYQKRAFSQRSSTPSVPKAKVPRKSLVNKEYDTRKEESR